MLEQIRNWFNEHIAIPGVPWWAELLILGFLMALVSIAVTAIALLVVPVDYFAGPEPPARPFRHPVVHWTLRILRNLVGWFLVILGILLSLPGIPGQGALTILLGVMLAEFPGKRRFEMWLIRKPGIHSAVNSLRRRFGRPALTVHNPSDVAGKTRLDS